MNLIDQSMRPENYFVVLFSFVDWLLQGQKLSKS